MSDTLQIFGKTFSNATGIVATDNTDTERTFIRPTGTMTIDENGTYDVSEYASAEVNIETGWAGDQDEPPEITDGKMHIWADIPKNATGELLNMPLRWTQTASNGVEVDWGDGTAPVTYSGTGAANRFHQYAQGGRYEIKISVLNGEIKFDDSTPTTQYWDAIYGSADGIGNYWCHVITGIYCPFEITTIADNFFRSMSALRFLAFPNARLTQINQRLLQSTSNLRTVDLGEKQGTIINILQYAFYYGVLSAPTITIPESVRLINDYAFGARYGISEYHFKPTTPPTLTSASSNIFYNVTSDVKIYVPRGCLSAYRGATNYGYIANYIQEEPT